MSIAYLALGFIAKIITGFDDVIIHTPILSSVAETKRGKIAFSIGTFIAVLLAIIFAKFIASFLGGFRYYRYIIGVLLIGLALVIYFNLFIHKKPKLKVEKKLHEYEKITSEKFLNLFGIGFLSSAATIIDDILIYIPLLVNGFNKAIFVGIGIMAATFLEIIAVIFFAGFFKKLRYDEEIASIGLIIMAILVLAGII